MYDTVDYAFRESMARERKVVTTYFSGEEFDCFFRRNNDGENDKDTMVMFYPADAPVSAGSLLNIGGKTYIALNKETIENLTYKKSAVKRTNGIINIQSGKVRGLPYFGDRVKNGLSTNGNYLSVIDGNLEIITEDCDISRNLAIDDVFNEWGRTWKIQNIYYVDGTAHIIIVVYADTVIEHNYRLEVTGLEELNVEPGAKAKITGKVYLNDELIENAAIAYSSSDVNIATIDNAGNIEYLADGQVFFEVSFYEKGISKNTDTVTVITAPVDDTLELYVEPTSIVYWGGDDNLIPYSVTRGGKKVSDIPVSFKIENLSGNAAYLKYIKVDSNAENVNIVIDDSRLSNMTFDLVAFNEEYELVNRQTIKIKSFF